MNIANSLFSPGFRLNEQIARQIFEILPEQGPIMLIMDKNGTCWPSNSEEYSKLKLSEAFLKEIRGKIDDGAEPIMTQVDDCSVIAAQLATERTNCGYVVVALPHHSPESALLNADLIEIMLSQVCLIAKLVEKNTLLYELQLKNHANMVGYQQREAVLN